MKRGDTVGTTNYRIVAMAGAYAGLRDGAEAGGPAVPGLRLRACRRLLQARHDPMALRLFELAYVRAFAEARSETGPGS